MTWFLALQGAAQMTSQPSVYELQDSVDVEKIAQELVSPATLDRAVPIPAVLQQSNRGQQTVTLYVRPTACRVSMFYQLSAEDRRQLAAEKPLLNALSQVAQQRG
jgi:hypothetical protein